MDTKEIEIPAEPQRAEAPPRAPRPSLLAPRNRPLRRNPRRSGGGEIPHLKVMPAWYALAAALAAGALAHLALSRRRRRTLAGYGLAGLVAALGAVLAGQRSARRPRLEQRSIPLRRWPQALDGLRIAQLSDLHLQGTWSVANLRQALRWVAQAQPDLIVCTGDFVNEPEDVELLEAELGGLHAPLGVYAILGNHDYWADPAALEQVLHRHGVTLLVNEHRVLEHSGARFVLAGTDEPWYGYADMQQTLAGAPQALPILLLSHCPDFILAARQWGVDLQLSGHSHAGHLALPLLGPAILPLLGRRYYRGLYHCGESWLYVSRGLGGRPLRLGAPPEVTLIELRSAP
jgi:predicted MPP superfamily phosphohydrolase